MGSMSDIEKNGVGSHGIYPAPTFEGAEKRLELRCLSDDGSYSSLRSIARAELDAMLAIAGCEIVSSIPGEALDAYMLSESTMFIDDTSIMLKTCGTTALLAAVPALLDIVKKVGMEVFGVKYSRARFLFPGAQPAPHNSWNDEVKYLERFFGGLSKFGGSAYVLGDSLNGLRWHVYTNENKSLKKDSLKQHKLPTIEICMSGIASDCSKRFYRGTRDGFTSAKDLTYTLGIDALVPPSSAIDDYLFEPCGYSMNAVSGKTASCMHVTPERECSFVSFELSLDGGVTRLKSLIQTCLDLFKPLHTSIIFSSGFESDLDLMSNCLPIMTSFDSYTTLGKTYQGILGHGSVLLANLRRSEKSSSGLRNINSSHTGRSDYQSVSPFEVSSFEDIYVCEEKEVKLPLLSPASVRGGDSSSLVSQVLADLDGTQIIDSEGEAIDTVTKYLIERHNIDDTFYVVDLGMVHRCWMEWHECLPRVEAFYAVKCNSDRGILSLMAKLGSNFDCASIAEVEAVTAVGVDPSRIIFANACKLPQHIRGATARGVDMFTFDCVGELKKMAKHAPQARQLLRIRADDESARCQLGTKFGAEMDEVKDLLLAAKKVGATVAGVAFHVGSGASDPRAFERALSLARDTFDVAAQLGIEMDVLDIGGGFSGGGIDSGIALADVSERLNRALDLYFPARSGVRIIAEPGRFFVEASSTLATQVFGVRERVYEESSRWNYFVTDGLYGSMNCIMYDHAKLTCRPLRFSQRYETDEEASSGGLKEEVFESTVFGPTCDGLDVVMEDVKLPKLECDDWILWEKMGAYTLSAASDFNGITATAAKSFYVYSKVKTGDRSCLLHQSIDCFRTDYSSDTSGSGESLDG